ncbi:MAG TPA: transcriptional repressor [Rhodoblastus sp.]|nr:transcriptional repressor [Rhodoblastus sp.]
MDKLPEQTDIYARMLREAGLKPTRQRLQIARLLFCGGGRHVTAETLFDETRAERYPPSQATIYNALRDFVRCGLLREVALYGSRLWYDTTTGSHYHYYVEESDRLFDMPAHAEPALAIAPPAGMQVIGVDVVVRLKDVAPRAPTLADH